MPRDFAKALAKAVLPVRLRRQIRRKQRAFLKNGLWCKDQSLPIRRDEWAIGIYRGNSLFQLKGPEAMPNPVMTREDIFDVPAAYVADPFMLKVQNTWHLFFEVMHAQAGKGVIGLGISENG